MKTFNKIFVYIGVRFILGSGAANFMAGKYAECLKSIKLERKSGVQRDKIEKLDKRE
jgi:hypothetical protein